MYFAENKTRRQKRFFFFFPPFLPLELDCRFSANVSRICAYSAVLFQLLCTVWDWLKDYENGEAELMGSVV